MTNSVLYTLFGNGTNELKIDGITYYILDGEATAVAYDGTTADVAIPATVGGYPVTSVKDIFKGKTTLKTLKIEANITAIANSMFSGCSNLTSITLPDSVTSIGSSAFSGCSKLVDVELPKELVSIGSNAFESCIALTAIEIPEKVKSIPSYAFNKCYALKRVVLPDGLYSIGQYAFNYCRVLEDISIPDAVRTIADYAFGNCEKLTYVNIPDGVTTLGFSCFEGCKSLKTVVIPNSVTKLEGDNFRDCSGLEEITLPGNMETWRLEFSGCSNLRKVIFSEGSTTVKAYNGFGSSIKEVILPSTLKEIKASAFSAYSGLTNVDIPEGVTTIGASAFANSVNMKTVVIPESVTSISTNSFHNTTLWLVYENSYAHTFAESNNCLYFVIQKVDNPEIAYGSSIIGTAKYTDGTVASGATVEILYDDGTLKESVTTDANGNYEFTYAEVGRYTIRVTDTKENTASETVSVKRMNVFDVYIAGETDLVLKKGYNVSGTVTPATAKVTISNTNGNIIKAIDVTNGAFTFADISRGSYIVKAENATGSATTEIYVSNEDVTGISLKIEAQSATITGDTKIENRDGTHSAKIWVNIDLIDENGNVVASTKTDSDGKYTFKNVPAGSYNIVATTNEMRPDIIGGFDKIHELKGYGYIDATEFITYSIDTIVLREDKVNLTSVSGKVTANGTTQDCQVILTNETGDQIAVFETNNNGKYNFVNIPDGMYCITAITKNDGMGFAVIAIENGVVHGDTDIKVVKADKISKREEILLAIPDCSTKQEALLYKEAVLTEKAFYDSLSEKERKQLSEEWTEKLFKLIGLISDTSIVSTEGVTVENVESIISSEEIDETIAFSITVTETTTTDAGEDGITSEEEYETEKIKDKKGKNKEIAKYYDITFSKDGQNISNIQKQTETNGKLRITMNIPEEYRGHKHYSFIHMHKGEAVTLVDLDDNPDTVTFEIDKFSTFALAYSDVELVGEVEETIYPASITYNAETGKISVSSTETGKLYIATYNGDSLSSVVSYDVVANASANDYYFNSNQAAYVWNENLKPLCEKFVIGN